MPFDYQRVLDALEDAADIAWLEERDREDREEAVSPPADEFGGEVQGEPTQWSTTTRSTHRRPHGCES